MVFTSYVFVVFAAIFFPIYFVTRGDARRWVCLIASYVFYGWWDWRFLFLIAFSTTLDYCLGLLLEKDNEEKYRRGLLIFSLIANLGILGFFKYFNFFAESFVEMANTLGFSVDRITLNVILPIGVSFYTFQSMSYTIDVYRRHIHAEPRLLNFAAFVSLFPQLVAGPIVRASLLLPQFREDHPFSRENLVRGLESIIYGYFLKLVVADNLSPFVDAHFAAPATFNAGELAVATLFFAFQIYGDFAGYSLIAIGLARIMGFDLGVNFRQPYLSASFSEFWQRWHISLSTWLRDYLYVSLGGNRHGTWKTYRNLILTMLLGGLWHGANWTFVIWGLLHGSYLVIQRLVGPVYRRVVPEGTPDRLVLAPIVFLLTCLAWIFFRANSDADAFTIIGRIFTGAGGWAPTEEAASAVTSGLWIVLIAFAIDLIYFHEGLMRRIEGNVWLRAMRYQALILLVLLAGSMTSQQFIYFQF